MPTLEKAISIALRAHDGKVDKAGAPYILHPLRVMLQMDTDEEMIAAVLHDVVEDTKITIDKLKELGFSQRVIEALDSVTRRGKKPNREPYYEFVRRAGKNPIGKKVKRADLLDNMYKGVKSPFDVCERVKSAVDSCVKYRKIRNWIVVGPS